MSAGPGFYSMNTLKKISHDNMVSLPFPARTVSNYPCFLFYQPSLTLYLKPVRMGLIYSFQSTGSRVSSSDYSGEYIFDVSVWSHAPGVIIELPVPANQNLELNLYCKLGVFLSEIKMKETLAIAGNNSDLSLNLNSISDFFEPGLRLSYQFNERMSLSLNIGYTKEFNRGNYYVEGSGNYIKPETNFSGSDFWDGIRTGISFHYKVKRTIKSD
jgi:hypothetical protein